MLCDVGCGVVLCVIRVVVLFNCYEYVCRMVGGRGRVIKLFVIVVLGSMCGLMGGIGVDVGINVCISNCGGVELLFIRFICVVFWILMVMVWVICWVLLNGLIMWWGLVWR